MVVHHFLLQARSQPVDLVGGWLLMLIYSERKVPLAGGCWLVVDKPNGTDRV
jgi:hypothetical protein